MSFRFDVFAIISAGRGLCPTLGAQRLSSERQRRDDGRPRRLILQRAFHFGHYVGVQFRYELRIVREIYYIEVHLGAYAYTVYARVRIRVYAIVEYRVAAE